MDVQNRDVGRADEIQNMAFLLCVGKVMCWVRLKLSSRVEKSEGKFTGGGVHVDVEVAQ